MVSLINAAALVVASVGQQSPQAEYEAYLARFANLPVITGSMIASGGPVGHPTISTFRVGPGGKCAIFLANQEIHSDGKTTCRYSPEQNKYVQTPAHPGVFLVLFGPRFSPAGSGPAVAESVKDGDYDGRPARVISIKARPNEAPCSLFVRKDSGLPIAVVYYGRQSQYATQIPELYLDRKSSDTLWNWTPPKGAVKAEFIRDNGS